MNHKHLFVAGVLVLGASGAAWAQSNNSISGVGDAVERDQPSASGLSSTESGAFRYGPRGAIEGRSEFQPPLAPQSPYVTSPPSE